MVGSHTFVVSSGTVLVPVEYHSKRTRQDGRGPPKSIAGKSTLATWPLEELFEHDKDDQTALSFSYTCINSVWVQLIYCTYLSP